MSQIALMWYGLTSRRLSAAMSSPVDGLERITHNTLRCLRGKNTKFCKNVPFIGKNLFFCLILPHKMFKFTEETLSRGIRCSI